MGSVPEESVAAAPEVVFRSRLPDIEIPNEQTLQSYCFAKMSEVGSRPCIIDGQTGASYTYAEVESLSRKAAAGLRRMGVGPAGGRGEPEPVLQQGGRAAVPAAAVPHLLAQLGAAGGAARRVGDGDHAQVRHRRAGGAGARARHHDRALRAAHRGGDRQEPPGDRRRPRLHPHGHVRRRAHGQGAAGRLHGQDPQRRARPGYGMTEAGPVLAMCLAFAKEPFKVKSGSCGTVVRNAALKIVDPDTGASLGRNQPGEICIRGEQIMKGYLNDPESTKNTIDKDGWLHTGDIGLVDDDDEIFIVDRLKEIIKYKGFQVAPAELEALLITHPEIKDAAVVSLKDDLAGEVPVAFVMRIEGSEITEDDIKKFVAKEVVFYKRIHKVFFTDSIPKNPSGKILRKDLRARLAAGIPS
ncbi:unnamed protein product [Triticum turgidum subsp. durum]|uniref:4-coumarate--CoA ligase n=1 Tax=Triticum turgidum subsp. durum TaxID=4567 RepID=A0A9R0YJZ0_TRITD|nr:unnamed protein product [Triticum turgidum subsp. durum]